MTRPALWTTVAAAAALVTLASCTATPTPQPVTPAAVPAASTACTAPPTARVTTAGELVEALAGARPGAVIELAPGAYRGGFVARTAGTEQRPVVLCGGRDSVLDGGPVDGGYALHLDGVAHWQVAGFTVRGGQKGVMADGVRATFIENLLVEGTGDEAVHLRSNSTDNVVRGNTIRDTGRRNGKFGEGVYIGSAESNWCELTGCAPDRSDRNLVEANTISATTSESVDIKEGTTGGVLRGNTFSGAGMTDADSWVDVKGNGWTIEANNGTDSPEDGFQVHEILEGWGLDNTFSANTAVVNAEGYGFNVTKNRDRNRVTCDNRAIGAGSGLSPEPCR